ncbi:hypothetical protein BKA69DRAFT_77204 [Paraphysoderma sedebokerense]|nr:hypothetical protein BKA69DRAFT_77204 [Paraphysoderma sedebokerense]
MTLPSIPQLIDSIQKIIPASLTLNSTRNSSTSPNVITRPTLPPTNGIQNPIVSNPQVNSTIGAVPATTNSSSAAVTPTTTSDPPIAPFIISGVLSGILVLAVLGLLYYHYKRKPGSTNRKSTSFFPPHSIFGKASQNDTSVTIPSFVSPNHDKTFPNFESGSVGSTKESIAGSRRDSMFSFASSDISEVVVEVRESNRHDEINDRMSQSLVENRGEQIVLTINGD